MKNKFTRFLMPIVASLSLSGCSILTNIVNNLFGEKNPITNNTGSGISKTSGYYKDYNLGLKGAFLECELQQMCFDKHSVYVRYSQYNSYCQKNSSRDSIEATAAGSSKNQYFYTGKEASGYGTREHVWPCANSDQLWSHDGSSVASVHNVDYTYYVGGGSDLYHVRTANSNVNTARGNSKFIDFDDPEFSYLTGIRSYTENNGKWPLKIEGYETTSTGTIQFAKKCEPADEMKGDVARIITYVWIHYGQHGANVTGEVNVSGHKYPKAEMCGSLQLTNIFGYDSIERCAKEISEWNKIDPPSEVEKLRNTTVQKIQGNRNMFVDFPELIDQLFDEYLSNED